MTMPAPTPAAAVKPGDADMIEAMFRAFGSLIPGAASWKFTPDQILEQLARNGAASTDLAVIRDWLTDRSDHGRP